MNGLSGLPMKECRTCKVVYPEDDSLNFCFNDGTPLTETADEPTLVIEDIPLDSTYNALLSIQTGQMLAKIYQFRELAWLAHDARFERLIDRYKNDDLSRCKEFVRRILGRAQIEFDRDDSDGSYILGIGTISQQLDRAISSTAEEGDQYLEELGYI